MDADQLEEGRELFIHTKDLEKKYAVDYLFTHSNGKANFNLKRRIVEIKLGEEVKKESYSIYVRFFFFIFALILVLILLKTELIAL